MLAELLVEGIGMIRRNEGVAMHTEGFLERRAHRADLCVQFGHVVTARLAAEGEGRLYYRVGLDLARASALGPVEQGLAVERSYEPAVDEDLVDLGRRDPGGFGLSWQPGSQP